MVHKSSPRNLYVRSAPDTMGCIYQLVPGLLPLAANRASCAVSITHHQHLPLRHLKPTDGQYKQLREKSRDLSTCLSPSSVSQLERLYGRRARDQMITFICIHIKYLVTKGSCVLWLSDVGFGRCLTNLVRALPSRQRLGSQVCQNLSVDRNPYQ